MTTSTITTDCPTVRESFRQWHAEQESLEGQLTESLSALAAYQSHLDAWQRELAGEREALERERKQLEQDHSRSGDQEGQVARLTTELSDVHVQNSALSKALLERTEELRQLDARRAELMTELESARAREQKLTASLDEQKRNLEQQQRQSAAELKLLREQLEQPVELAETEWNEWGRDAEQPGDRDHPTSNPVLGSIVEQFGKLRQQRALERQTRTNTE